MSVLAQNNKFYFLSSKHHVHTSPFPIFRTSVHCSATTTTTRTNTKPSPDQLLIEPRLVHPPTPVTVTPAPPALNDPALLSTWSHRAWVASGCSTLLTSLTKSILVASNSHIWIQPVLAGLVGYVLADLGSGVYHWGIDNYGSASTPVFGSQIEAFQGHHKWPWTITRRQFANNLHALARVITFTVLPISLVCDDPTVLGFVSVFSGCIMFSQQFHSWAHCTKSRLPPLVVELQDLGILVSRLQHAAHHRIPYNSNYCIVSGVWNEFLDKQKVFEALELILFFKLGVRPRSWDEPNADWTEDIETTSQIITNS